MRGYLWFLVGQVSYFLAGGALAYITHKMAGMGLTDSLLVTVAVATMIYGGTLATLTGYDEVIQKIKHEPTL